jgi:hypothetical protein
VASRTSVSSALNSWSIDGAGQGPVALFIEASGDAFDRVGEEGVVLEIEFADGEPGLDGGEEGEHGSKDGVMEWWWEGVNREIRVNTLATQVDRHAVW